MIETKLNTDGIKCENCERPATVMRRSKEHTCEFLCPQCSSGTVTQLRTVVQEGRPQRAGKGWNPTGHTNIRRTGKRWR